MRKTKIIKTRPYSKMRSDESCIKCNNRKPRAICIVVQTIKTKNNRTIYVHTNLGCSECPYKNREWGQYDKFTWMSKTIGRTLNWLYFKGIRIMK